MSVAGKKVAILVDNYFEQAEFEEPLAALKDAGAEVEVVAASTRNLQALQHADKGDQFTADVLLEETDIDDYDALVLPGGAINADTLRMNNEARAWVRDFAGSDKPLAAICHAPWLLASAGVLNDRHITSYFTIQDDVRNAGGEWSDNPVVVDGNLITSRQPDDLPQFNEAIISMLNNENAS